MNLLDWLLLAMMMIGFLIGYKVGAVKQISFGAGITLGLLQALVLYTKAGFWIYSKTEWSHWICNVIAIILIMAAVMVLVHIIGKIVTVILDIIHLRIVERIMCHLLHIHCSAVACFNSTHQRPFLTRRQGLG